MHAANTVVLWYACCDIGFFSHRLRPSAFRFLPPYEVGVWDFHQSPFCSDSHLCDWGHALLVYDSMLLFLRHFLLIFGDMHSCSNFCYLTLLCYAFSVISTIVLYVPHVEIKRVVLSRRLAGRPRPSGLTHRFSFF